MGTKIATVVAERILADRRVRAALASLASVQSDFDEFDGDRRGISEHLWNAKIELVKSVGQTLRTVAKEDSFSESGNGFRHCKPSWLRKGIKVQCLDSGGGVFVVEMVEKASGQHPAFFTVRRQKSMRESRIVSCTADVMRSWVRWEG